MATPPTNDTIRELALQARRYSSEINYKVGRARTTTFGPQPVDGPSGSEQSDPPIQDILRDAVNLLAQTDGDLARFNDGLGSLGELKTATMPPGAYVR